MTSHFPLAVFKILSMSLTYDKLVMFLCVDFFGFIIVGSLWDFLNVDIHFLPQTEKFLAIISLNKLSDPFSHFLGVL